jgi:two-component system alkaline phosphatase synthesis response regulator PhoP
MARILIIASENKEIKELAQGLSRAGFDFFVVPREEADAKLAENPPDLVLVYIEGANSAASFSGLIKDLSGNALLPVVAAVAKERLSDITAELPISDFVVSPYNIPELILRIKRQLMVTGSAEEGGFIKAGDLVIDTAKAEILIKGNRVELTYREYELLRFLASSPGRVFTREALLNKVWGYDYYGGDRTVDVHIRRLRSKIETDELTFIETVRNIGYRFRDDLETTIV